MYTIDAAAMPPLGVALELSGDNGTKAVFCTAIRMGINPKLP